MLDKLPGRTLGKQYRVVRPIGSGGMGVVFEAFHIELGRRVALKVLLETDTRALERFQQEARATAKLDSPHIVGVTDFRHDGGEPPFIVMELLDGRSLQAVLRHERVLGADEATRVADQVLSGLALAHQVGIVHRDVKPANVFLVTNTTGAPPTIKILDFGIAKLAAEAGGMQTTVGTVLGTPAYLAPEQIMGNGVDPRTDVHAVGLVLYEMLVGARPWPELRGPALGRALVEDVPPPITRPDVPAKLAALVARALAKDPGARFADAAAMRVELRSIVTTLAELDTEAPADVRVPDTVREPDLDTLRMVEARSASLPRVASTGTRPIRVVAASLVILAAMLDILAGPEDAPPLPSVPTSAASFEAPPNGPTPPVAIGAVEPSIASLPATGMGEAPQDAPALRPRPRTTRPRTPPVVPPPARGVGLAEAGSVPSPHRCLGFLDPLTGRCWEQPLE